MAEQLKMILSNPTVGRIATIIIGIAIIWIIVKTVQKNIFTKIKDNDHRYKAKKFSGFVGYLLTIILLSVVFSDKLGGLTVAIGVAGAGIAFSYKKLLFHSLAG